VKNADTGVGVLLHLLRPTVLRDCCYGFYR